MELSLPHSGGKPISNRIVADLLIQLKTGIYADKAYLPSEVFLAAHYKVSRAVVRDALSNLEREGFVERIRGVGTVIHRDIVNLAMRIDLKYEYNDLIFSMGRRPVTDSVKVYIEQASESLAERLKVPVGSDLLVIEKRLLADETPVIYSIDRLPLFFFHGVPYGSLDWRVPLFDILEQYKGVTVDTDIARLSSVYGSPEIREKLSLSEDESLIRIDEIGYYKLSHPIFQTYGYYTNFFEFTVLRKMI